MDIHIDLSNRLEESGPTFIACCNHISYVIKIPTNVKQFGLTVAQERGLPRKQIRPFLWSISVFLALEYHLDGIVRTATKIILDNEFDGYQIGIKRDLLAFIRSRYDRFPAHKIMIASIGKQSPAHMAAWQAKKGKTRVNRVITWEEMAKLVVQP